MSMDYWRVKLDGFLDKLSEVLQFIVWLLYGPRKKDLLEGSVQGYDILADMKPRSAMINEKSFFLHKFIGLKDVSYLDRADVTLYSVTEDEFVFVRTKPEVDIFNTEKHPFIYNIQHSAAEEVLTASHNTVFQYLRSKPERDGKNISYLHNPGRCGSTLVAAMMFSTNQCVVLSEPTPALHLALMFNKKDYPASRKTVEYLEIVRATFLLLCPDPEKLYFIKPWGLQTLSLLPLLNQALPGIKEMFMFRSVQPTVLSFKKLVGSENFFELAGNWAISKFPVNYRNIWEKVKRGKGDEVWCFLVLSQIHAYMLETQDRTDVRSYSYESLLKNKEAFARSLLKEVGVGEDYLGDALSALDRDSQANSVTHKKEKVAAVKMSIDADAIRWAKEVARNEFGLELVGDDGQISNMTHQWFKCSE